MQFGKVTTTTPRPDGSTDILMQSFHKGNVKTERKFYEVPHLVADKSGTLSKIISGLDLISSKQTKKLYIEVDADAKYQMRLVTIKYEVEE